MSKANALEEQMLKLVNGERSDAGLNPLRFNDTLNTSSEDHSSWMLDKDVFDHQGISGSSPHDRMVSAGYPFEGNWHSGENIAFMSEDDKPGYKDEVDELHDGLMNSPGHRANILNPNFTEIGIGIENGKFADANGEYDALMISQNFAHTDAVPVATDVPPVVPVDEVPDEVIPVDPPVVPVDEVTDEVVTDDTPDEPVDEVTDEVVTDDTPDAPVDEVTDEVVTDDTPDEPVDEVTDEVTAAADLWDMFNAMFDGFTGSDSFVFASFGTVTNIEGQGALIHAETIFFIPEEFGAFQQGAGQPGGDVTQVSDMQIPDIPTAENDLSICSGFDSFIG